MEKKVSSKLLFSFISNQMQNRLGKKMKNQIFYDIVPLGKYYCDNFLSAFIIIQIQFIKALESFKQYLQPDLCLTLVPFDLSVLV